MPQSATRDDKKIRQKAIICNRKGLHARAAAKFVKLASSFRATIKVRCQSAEVAGNSIMGLMMLAASPGTELEIEAVGPDAEKAVGALIELIERKFDEDPL